MKMEIYSGLSSNGKFMIYVRDEESGIRFLELEMTPENFAFMLSNRPVECEGEVNRLEHVGKKHYREARTVVYTGKDTSKAAIRLWLLETHQEHGWTINSYLGSQDSMVYIPESGHYEINYTVEKWV